MNSNIKNSNWITGGGQRISFSRICEKVNAASSDKSKIFIGTDSAVKSRQVTFCSAICIYGNCRSFYYFCKNRVNNNTYPDLISRITEETRLSIEIAEYLHTRMGIDKSKIELHLDVSPWHKGTKTSKISESLKGYVLGTGYECKLKPYAWASQSVADRHSK